MKLKPNVDFKNPVRVAYMNGEEYRAFAVTGTTRTEDSEGIVYARSDRPATTFLSKEECTLDSEARGLPVMFVGEDPKWLPYYKSFVEFIRKHNPEAVEGGLTFSENENITWHQI